LITGILSLFIAEYSSIGEGLALLNIRFVEVWWNNFVFLHSFIHFWYRKRLHFVYLITCSMSGQTNIRLA